MRHQGLSPIKKLAKLCRDVPPERLYDKKEKGGLYKRIWDYFWQAVLDQLARNNPPAKKG
jgi:hypothetical protein